MDTGDYVRVEGGWEPSAATDIVSFSAAFTAGSASASSPLYYSSATIAYPAPRPGEIPRVSVEAIANPTAGAVQWASVSAKSDTQVQIRLVRVGAAPVSGTADVTLYYG